MQQTSEAPRLADTGKHERLPEHDLLNSLIGKWITEGETIPNDASPAQKIGGLERHRVLTVELAVDKRIHLHGFANRLGEALRGVSRELLDLVDEMRLVRVVQRVRNVRQLFEMIAFHQSTDFLESRQSDVAMGRDANRP